MKKNVILRKASVKKFNQLLKRSSSLDNMVFIQLKGSEYESIAYNRTKSVLKSVTANLETMCEEFSNPFGDNAIVKIQFANVSKLINTLALVGDDLVDIVFDIDESNNYAHKVTIKNEEMNVTINCADKEAVDFLEVPQQARHTIYEDKSRLQCTASITESEFKKIKGLFGLNKDSARVFFNLVNGDELVVSEIESTDENVRQMVNEIITESDFEGFRNFDKLYDKKLITTEFSIQDGVENYLNCFNKQWFDWIDSDKTYDIEFHSNKIKFVSMDEDTGIKTFVMLSPVKFA